MKKLKFWHWILIAVIPTAVLIVVGIGFIPVTRTVPYPCSQTEYYDCDVTEEYPCQESYICYHDEAYTYTETEYLTYNQYDTTAGTGFWGDATVSTWVRNTDSVGGYFHVYFEVVISSVTSYYTQNQWISAGDTYNFAHTFPRSWGETWSWDTPIVTAPTKTVQKIGTHSVSGTCYRNGTCTRDVWTSNGCSRQVEATCYREEQERLFW